MESQKTQNLSKFIDAFASELHCSLCECIQKHLKSGKSECPQCAVPIQGKSLTRNSSYSTMVQCISKIRNLLNGTPTTQPPKEVSENQADVLMSILGGVIEEEEDDSKKKKMKKSTNEPKKRKTEEISGKDTLKKVSIESKVKEIDSDRYGLLLTGLSEDQKATIQSNLLKLTKHSGNKPFKIIKDYSTDHVTHIICACAPKSHCPRTLKYLLGIAGKAWIVSFDWILESLEAGKVLPEKDFVVTGDEAVQCDTNACERSRADPKKLFENRKFHLAGLFNAPGPSKSDLMNLIQTAGGVIVGKKVGKDVFVVSNNSNGPKPNEMHYTWLFDAVSLYEIK